MTHPLRAGVALAAAAAIAAAGCRPKSLVGLYCQGGVINGTSNGGECMQISADKPDTDPDTVGSATFVRRFTERHTVRRAGKSKYKLLLEGVPSGVIEQDGDWIVVTFSNGETYRMRSDAPGPLA